MIRLSYPFFLLSPEILYTHSFNIESFTLYVHGKKDKSATLQYAQLERQSIRHFICISSIRIPFKIFS